MNLDAFEEMKAWVGFGPDDAARLQTFLVKAEPGLDRVVKRFYDDILRFPRAASVFEDLSQVERLMGSLRLWLREVLTGPYDAAYHQRHLRIGHRHVEVGLQQQYMFTAMNTLRASLLDLCQEVYHGSDCVAVIGSLHKILDIELAVMLDTYTLDKRTQELEDLRNLLMKNLPLAAMLLDGEGFVSTATGPLRPRMERGQDRVHYTEMFDAAFVKAADLPRLISEAESTGQPMQIARVDVGGADGKRTYRVTIIPLEHPQARLLIHTEDLTEVIASESRLRHSENLAQLGHMAAAIAHELRNPLAGFSGTMQVLLNTLPENDRRRTIMSKVLEQIKRLDDLVTDLLQFARPVQVECEDVDLKQLARRVASQISLAEIGTASVKGSGFAYADAGLLQQAVYNLVLNAFQAGAERVEVRVREGALSVEDDGPGVPAAKEVEIFKPFVTTRTRGTGLGLPNARRFVEAMGGTLELSVSGLGGAGFEVRLLPARTSSEGRVSPSDTEEHIG